MEKGLWCRILVLTVCVRRSIASDPSSAKVITSIPWEKKVFPITTESPVPATTHHQHHRPWSLQRHNGDGLVIRTARATHDDYDADDALVHHNEISDTKAISQPKTDYWGGYYDFLINEGSYKFWAVFQLATAALLIYSGFAALYYAKVNPPVSNDYDDDFLLRRRRRSIKWDMPPKDRPFFGLNPQSFQRILDAIGQEQIQARN